MTTLLRALRLPAHVALSLAALAWFALARRRATLLFTHAGDVDEEHRDRQMGPLADALAARGQPFAEVILVSLSGGLVATLLRTRRLFVSHAAVLAGARLLALLPGRERDDARASVGYALLRVLRPRRVFLIDESGSGETLLRAARRARIPVFGVQHGDFQPTNAQYALPPERARDVPTVDLLFVWSPWFRARLLAVSPLYAERTTRVSGRLRYPDPPPAARPGARLSVLVVAEPGPAFRAAVTPFLEELHRAGDLAVRVRAHPAEAAAAWPGVELARGSLARALVDADVVCGRSSSALLEALWHERPALVLGADPAGYAAERLAERCDDPRAVARACHVLSQLPVAMRRERRARVWGGAPDDAVAALLDEQTAAPGAAR